MKNKTDTNPPKTNTHKKTPLIRVIRKACMYCTLNKPSEIRKCYINECPLWPYRMGKNPHHKRKS